MNKELLLQKITDFSKRENIKLELKFIDGKWKIIGPNGKVERKGACVMPLSDLSNDLPIVNQALVDFMVKGIPVERTILECNEMIKFQKVYRVTSSYKLAWHNNEYLPERTFRVYASKDRNDTYLARCRDVGTTPEKFGNCPEHCFIMNGEVNDIPMSIKVDKRWYVNLAKRRLRDFGFDVQMSSEVF